MRSTEWAKYWHYPRLDVALLHAFYDQHAYPPHSHDYYVISLIQHGLQSFTHGGNKYFTPHGGVILINPQSVHTGEPADANGFELRSIYPTAAAMQQVVGELTGEHVRQPYFSTLRVDDPQVTTAILGLHRSLIAGTSALEYETRFIQTMALLVKRYADVRPVNQRIGHERAAVRKARALIEASFDQGISLKDLADSAALSPYYLVRVFHAEVGMPPYSYLENVRIRQAQRLIEVGRPLVDVAVEVGFSSQSHLTRHFKRIIGVTPGEYAREIKQHAR